MNEHTVMTHDDGKTLLLVLWIHVFAASCGIARRCHRLQVATDLHQSWQRPPEYCQLLHRLHVHVPDTSRHHVPTCKDTLNPKPVTMPTQALNALTSPGNSWARDPRPQAGRASATSGSLSRAFASACGDLMRSAFMWVSGGRL